MSTYTVTYSWWAVFIPIGFVVAFVAYLLLALWLTNRRYK